MKGSSGSLGLAGLLASGPGDEGMFTGYLAELEIGEDGTGEDVAFGRCDIEDGWRSVLCLVGVSFCDIE